MPKSRPELAAVSPLPTPRLALSIRRFCEAHGISEGFFYKLKKQGEGPRVMKVGARTLITFEFAAKWRAAREAVGRSRSLRVRRSVGAGEPRRQFGNDHVEDVMSRDQFGRLIETTENPVVEHNGHSVPSTLLPSGPSIRNPGLNRAQQRCRMAELGDRLDGIARDDLNYFTWFSDRKYRLRVADPAEIEPGRAAWRSMTLPPGKQHYMVVYRMIRIVACAHLSPAPRMPIRSCFMRNWLVRFSRKTAKSKFPMS